MGNLFVHVTLDHKAALLTGETRAGNLAIPVTNTLLETLTPGEREALLQSVSESHDSLKPELRHWSDRLPIDSLSDEGIKKALRARLLARVEALAAEAAKHVEVEALFAGPAEARLTYDPNAAIGHRYQVTDAARKIVGYSGEHSDRIRAEQRKLDEADTAFEDGCACVAPVAKHIAVHDGRWVVTVTHALPLAHARAQAECAARNAEIARVTALDAAEQEEQFAAFVESILSHEQCGRFRAGCLPVAERDAVIRAFLFRGFEHFAPYAKLESSDVNHDNDCPDGRVSFSVEVIESTPMTASQYESWSAIGAVVQNNENASVKLREHGASCHDCGAEDVTRLGAKVTIKLASHSYSREFAI